MSREGFLHNRGELPFDFDWNVGACRAVSVEPSKGRLLPSSSLSFWVHYHPAVPGALKDEKIQCRLRQGPSFDVLLHGKAVKPKIYLSFEKYDFGTVFTRRKGMPALEAQLTIRNKAKKNVHLRLVPSHRDLTVTPSETELLALKETCVQIWWYPVEEGKLNAMVRICVDGGYSKEVSLRGASIPLNLVPSTRLLNFGNVSPHVRKTERLELCNRSAIPVRLSFAPSLGLLEKRNLHLQSSPTLCIPGRATEHIAIDFAPTERCGAFEETCFVDIEETPTALFHIQCESRASDLQLSPSFADFGDVAAGSAKIEHIRLTNNGTEDAAFRWISTHDAFRVIPEEDTLAAGQKRNYAVHFCPIQPTASSIAAALACQTETGVQCEVAVKARCVSCPVHEDVLRFSCPPGRRTSQSIVVSNPTSDTWRDVRVHVSNATWSLTQKHEVPPLESSNFEITFAPSGEQRGEVKGTLWLQFPNGQGQKFFLLGTVEPSVERRALQRVLPLRTSHTEEIRIHNRTPVKQQFDVVIQRETCPDSIFIQGTDFFEVPKHAERPYRLRFESHYEGDAVFSVVFKNSDKSGDVILCECSFRSVQPDAKPIVRLECAVRSEAAKTIQLYNPLTSDVPIRIEGPEEVEFLRQQVLAAESEHELPLRYRPLFEGEKAAGLTISSEHLAPWHCDLILKGRRPSPEPLLKFQTCLGDFQKRVMTLRNEGPEDATWRCRVESDATGAFHCDPRTVATGPSLSISVVYEPTECGSCQEARLFVESDTGGIYDVPLFGTCAPPPPKGPIHVAPSASLSFKNVFADATHFTCTVDNPVFKVTTLGKLASKETRQIPIECHKKSETGVLVVNSQSSRWLYYLQS